jgi:hypothetical protein
VGFGAYRYAVGVGFWVLVGFNVGLLVDVDGVGGSTAEVDGPVGTRTGLLWVGGMALCDM